ncbi:MAG: alpha/beta fold hydrolase [bacterium]|nr:alpha/beta fold hydrolase [bacterium]
MASCETIEIVTPKRVLLNGLWFGPKKARNVFIIVHGLASSIFSRVPLELPAFIINRDTAVLSFNNRGHDIVSKARRNKRAIVAGGAHEVFTDCVDDIRGAVNFARRTGAKNIYLVGHSTGCQKSVYYASKLRKRPLVVGLILLAPVSDYAAAKKDDKNGQLAKAVKFARTMIKAGKKHELMPKTLDKTPFINDAQRFLSLYTPDSPETIFSYEQPKKNPRTLQSVMLPMFVVWAEKDEYADRPARKITEWFERNTGANLETLIVPSATHSFRGKEIQVASAIKKWIVEN